MKQSTVKILAALVVLISIAALIFPKFIRENHIRIPLILLVGVIVGMLAMNAKLIKR